MHSEYSDTELVRRFQRGDQQAFEVLVERYHQRVFRMASVSLIVPEHSADVAQEVFVRAYRGLRTFRFQAQPYTWLFKTMKNVCREYNRKERYVAQEMDTLLVENKMELNLHNKNQLTAIRRLLKTLPSRQRDVVLLRVFEDQSVEETAKAMNCRPGTVKALLHQALKKIRAETEDIEL